MKSVHMQDGFCDEGWMPKSYIFSKRTLSVPIYSYWSTSLELVHLSLNELWRFATLFFSEREGPELATVPFVTVRIGLRLWGRSMALKEDFCPCMFDSMVNNDATLSRGVNLQPYAS